MSVGKKIKKITSIILIISMVMTSGGIHTFSNSMDDLINEMEKGESSESLSRKYYDDMMNENSDETVEDEEKNQDKETNSQDETSEGSKNENSDEKSSESDEATEESETKKISDEEPEEDDNEKPSDEETTESNSTTDESESVEESETQEETTLAFDEKNDIASDSEIDADTDTIEEEDNISTTSEVDPIIDEDAEDAPIATPNDADENSGEEIRVASYSELFTVATDSIILDKFKEATESEINGEYGKRSYTQYEKQAKVPAIVVWGDVGYRGQSHVDEGYLGMYIGGTDEVGHGQEAHKYNGKKNEEGTNGLHYMGSRSIRNILSLEYKNRDEWMPAPQFIEHTGWYVQARGKFAKYAIGNQSTSGGVRANHYSGKDTREHKTWTNNDLRALWSDFLKVPFKSYGAEAKGGQHLETLINQQGGNFSILNNNQDIRGYIVNGKNKNGTYNLSLVHNVKFNNEWGMKEKESNSSWHIESLDDEITQHTNGGEQYDWTTKYNVAYYGIHVTDAEGEVTTRAGWKNSGWKDGDTTIKLWADQVNDDYYTITVPTEDKNVYWNDGKGKTYKLIGWVPSYQNMWSNKGDYERDNGKNKQETVYRVDPINHNPVLNLNGQTVYKPGETIKWKMSTDKEWPVTFGPFYRDAYTLTIPEFFREGYRYGMADKGVLYIHSDNNTGWNMITKIDRMRNEWGSGNGDKRRQIGSVQYNMIFFSPVLEEYKEKTISYDLNGGNWRNKDHSNTIIANNFTYKDLPTSADVTRTGYNFDGWYTARTGGLKVISVGKNQIEDNVTVLYARWTPKKYNIVIRDTVATASTIQVSGGKATWIDKAYSKAEDKKIYEQVPYDSTITLPEKYDITGFNFIGFSQDKNSKIKTWSGNETVNVKDLALNDKGTTYIYPIYEEKKTTIRFDGGDAVASDKKRFSSKYGVTKTFNYHGGFMLPEPDGITGFDFAGWEVGRTVDKTKLKEIIPANDPKLKFSDYTDWFDYNLTWTYTATWKEKEYTIDFKGGKVKASDGATYNSSTSSVVTTKYYSKIKVPTDFTLTDFTFNGFAKEENSDSIFLAKNADVTAGSVASDLSETEVTKLYGIWIEDEVKVVFNGGKSKASDGKIKESKSNSEKTYKLKSKVEIPQDFVLEGFNFKGFNKKDQVSEVTLPLTDTNKKSATELVSEFGKNEDGNLAFYGVWDEKKYNVRIDAGTKEANGKLYVGTGSVAAKVYGYHSNISMPTETTMKMKSFKLRGFSKVDQDDTVKYTPDQVVDVTDLIEYLSMDEYKEGNTDPYVLYGAWDIAGGTIKLKANIGYFLDNKREKTLKPEKMGKALNEYEGYEEPVETDDYVFSHWEDENKNKYYGESIVIGDIELSAQYKDKPKEEVKVPTYTIQVVNDDTKGTYTGTPSFALRLGDNIIASMSEAGVIDPVANERYIFLGWSFDGANLINDTDMYTDTTKNKIYAVYKEKTISITLSSATGEFKGGKRVINIISTRSIPLNEYKEYEEPTKEEYTFKNWLNEGVEVASNSIITTDTTLVANYEKIVIVEEEPKYTITVLNDDTLGTYTGPTSFELTFGNSILASMSELGVVDPVAEEGYTFLGWSWTGDKDNLITNTDKYIDISLSTISTVYKEDTYTVILSAHDGEFSDGRNIKAITSNTKKALNTFEGYEEPTKDKYAFKMWTSEGVEVASNSIITTDMTLVAKYEKVDSDDDSEEQTDEEETKYTIVVLNDETLGTYTGPDSFELVFDSKVLASMSELGVVDPVAKEGYTFLGWSWTGDKNNLINEHERYVDIRLATISTVYKQDSYTVILSARDGVFSDGRSIKAITSNIKKPLNAFEGYEEPTKDEYDFKIWTYDDIEIASNSIITTDMTLIASFEKKVVPETPVEETKYAITVLNDDTLGTYTGPTSFELTFGSNILASMSELGVVDPVASKDYTFLGWSWTGDKNNLIKNTDRYYDISLSTISTVYSQDTYRVILSAGDGAFANGEKTKVITSHTKEALNAYEEYEEPTKEKYEFIRWVDVNEIEVASTSIITKDMVLYASFRKIAEEIVDTRYTVTIANDSDKGVIKVKGEEKDVVVFKIGIGQDVLVTLASASITAEAKEGYVFKGWSWTGDIASIIKPGDKYEDSKNTNLKPVYTRIGEKTVVLKANTGVFMSRGERTLTIVSETAKSLLNFDNYERPVKESATFDRWVKEDGTTFAENDLVYDDLILTVIYKDASGNDVGADDATKDGGADASYTVMVKNDATKGTMSNADRITISEKEYDVAFLDIKLNDKILDKIKSNGLTIDPDKDRWIYEGWSRTHDLNGLIDEEDVYESEDLTEINAAYYKTIHIKVVLNANTGVFVNAGKRIIEMNSTKKIELGDFVNYEEPVKSDEYKFVRWEDATGNKYETTYVFGEESDNKDIELFAIYTDENGNIIGRGETKDGGSKAYYTVFTKYDPSKAQHNSSSFEVQKDGLVKQAMIDYDAYEAIEVEGWWEKGWSFDNSITNLINDTTLYDDITQTTIYAQYVDTNKWTIVLNANTGLFKDNTREKVLENTKKVAINKFTNYEVPEKADGFKFDHWEDASGKTYKATDLPPNPFDLVLYAIYKDNKGNEIGKGDTKDGGADATYTIRLSSDAAKGTLGAVKKFEIAKGSYILATMSEAGVKDPTPKANNYFVGWTWDKDLYDYVVTSDNIYKGNEGTVLHALYSDELFEVTLRTNTGIFTSENSREKTLQVPKYQLLRASDGYEEPIKTDATFNRWIKNGSPIGELKTYKITEPQVLDATYRANDGSNDNIGKDGDTEDGGKNATYTIRVLNNENFGSYTGAEYFEINKGGVIYTTMKAAGVTEGEAKLGYAFRGWKHGSNLITALTTYEDTSIATLNLEYSNQTIELTLDASFGRFKDKSQLKVFNVARGRVINTIADYEEPTKMNWTFNRWLDELGSEVASSSTLPLNEQKLRLKAMYKNADGYEVDEDGHKHLICGALDETASHALDVIASHEEQVSFFPVTTSEEFVDYINAELAKEPTERNDIKLYLEEDITIDENIELDDGVNLFICLNGHTLNATQLGNRVDRNGKIYITNCRNSEASVVEKTSDDNLNKAFFGANEVHVLSAKGKINITPTGKLVAIASSGNIIPKEVEFMNVKIENSEGVTVDKLIDVEGKSYVRFVDVDVKNITATDTVVGVYEGAELFIGGEVNITNNKTNKSIMDVQAAFRLADNSVLRLVDNTIIKKENGDTAVIFMGSDSNYVGGHLIVKDNKLELTSDYKKLVETKPVEDKKDESGNEEDDGNTEEFDNNLGVYDEEVSPAGEVGYSSAVAFTKENIGFDVGNAKIEIYGNESAASGSNIRAEYMYQLRSLNNTRNALIRQGAGTVLDEDSVIGVAFASEDGEGLLADNAKIGKEIFRNKTFGKEEKLLNIKENENGNLELMRKTYTVVYHEGTPTTNEQKLVIDALLPDGSTISEATRVRSGVIKAGHNVTLEGDRIYHAKGFNLATYSLINKRNEVLGNFDPRATISYIDSLFGSGEDIEDGDIIRADALYEEKSLKSEAKPLVITKEDYEEMVNAAVVDAVTKAASASEADQAIEDKEEDYYTIRYHLNGGLFEGIELEDKEVYEETNINKKDNHILLVDVTKVATESGVKKVYDFIGWYLRYDDGEYDDSPITQIAAKTNEEAVIDVYAQYLPSTYKITYHLEGGMLEGYEGDTIEEIVSRKMDYTLIKGVTKADYIFTKWRIENDGDTMYADSIEAESIANDIDAYAEYSTALYEVTYNLNGGVIKEVTSEGQETYVDSNANILKDYYLPQEVTKEDYKFTGWETMRGVKVDRIAAGDTDESKREVIATFAPSTWKVIYDTDEGTIEGFPQGNVTDKIPEGIEYKLYTDVKKDGYEFAYWYDVKSPTTKVEFIKDAVGGNEFRVKAKYNPLTYDLRLHIDGETTPRVLRNINNKLDFILPTDIEVEDKEFVNWSYKDAHGANVVIESIEAGNPNNITDIYANYEDLMTWRIIYHLGPDEYIEGITEYDSTSTAEEKTKTITMNRRKNISLYNKVVKESVEEKEDEEELKPIILGAADDIYDASEKKYEFYGWTSGKREAPDSLEDLGATFRFFDGVSKESEERDINLYDDYNKYRDWHWYPYFVSVHAGTADVEYHFVNGGSLPDKEIVDGRCVETVNAGVDLNLIHYYSMSENLNPGYEFEGIYRDEACTGDRVIVISGDQIQEIADAGETLHLYVKFKKIKYDLKYYVNGGTMPGKRLADGNTVYSTTYDNRIETKLDTNIVKAGYVFDGWKVSDDDDSERITKIAAGNATDVEVYASWKKDSYTITYMLNGGRVAGKPSGSYTETYRTNTKNVLVTDVTKSRNRFMGWYTEPNGQGTKYEAIDAFAEITDLTLYAYYESTLYAVTYVLNGGTLKGKRLLSSGQYIDVYDSKEDVKLYDRNDVVHDNGFFDRWVDEDGKEYTHLEKGHVGNLTLYAEYSTKTVDITFNIGEKGVAVGKKTKEGKFTQTFNIGEDIELTNDITWSDVKKNSITQKNYKEYNFAGWYTNSEYKGKRVVTIPKGNPDNITELYAKWEVAVYNIVYHLNGGAISGLLRIDYDDISQDVTGLNDEYELPQDVRKTNSIFAGWYDNVGFTGNSITKLTAMPRQRKDNTVHLYARWKQTQYKVTYSSEKRSAYGYYSSKRTYTVESNAPYVLIGEDHYMITEYTDKDTVFDGWYQKNAWGEYIGDEIIYIDTNASDDITVYSKFIKLSELSDEEKAAYEARKAERAEKRKQAEEHRQSVIRQNSGNAGSQTRDDLQPGTDAYYDYIIRQLLASLFGDDSVSPQYIKVQTTSSSKEDSMLNKLLGGLSDAFDKILGDDDDDNDDDADPSIPEGDASEEVEVNISDLLAYDTVSANKLGMDTPKGTVLDCVVITYIKDAEGNDVLDPKYIGKVLKAGANFSDLAEDYGGHLLGVRAIFVDEKIFEKPAQPGYRGGGNYGGGSGKGGGGGGGRLAAGHNDIIVNPYGFDGRGSDNGAARAEVLKQDINAKLGRKATPSYPVYKTLDIEKDGANAAGLTGETWEYFPASNSFKMYMTSLAGDRYYLANGWHSHTSNSQKMWYRFDNDGIMQRGFVEEGGKVYYLNNSINDLAYMVKGYKDFEGTGYTGYFGNDGALLTIFPTSAKIAFEQNIATLPQEPNYDRALYEQCKLLDRESTRIVKTEKTYGQSAMGNFVGYWYYMASGQKKLRFETINTELQIVRFAADGWMNVYDVDNNLYSYRFDGAANLLVNNITPEGLIVGANGHLADKNMLIDFAYLDAAKKSGYVLATFTANTLPVNSEKLKSRYVEITGTPMQNTPATDIWTVIDFQGAVPVLTNSLYGGTSVQPVVQQPLQFLSNAANTVTNVFNIAQTNDEVPSINPIEFMNPINVVKMTKVLSSIDYKKGMKTITEVTTDRNITSVYGICMDIYNTVMDLFAA